VPTVRPVGVQAEEEQAPPKAIVIAGVTGLFAVETSKVKVLETGPASEFAVSV
jgi:hypothetical protein